MREKNQQKDRFLVVGVPCDPSKVSGADSLAQIVRITMPRVPIGSAASATRLHTFYFVCNLLSPNDEPWPR